DNAHRMHDRTSSNVALGLDATRCTEAERAVSGAADDLAQADLDERRVQPDGQRGELPHGLLGARLGLAAALPDHRFDDLREQPDLAFGGGAERPQVAA